MEFLKNNLFYAILIVAVLVVSIPSYILASAREAAYKKAFSTAQNKLRTVQKQAADLKPVSSNAIAEAGDFRKKWEQMQSQVVADLTAADRHLDYDFLVPPAKEGDVPAAERYRASYGAAYDELMNRLFEANLADPKRTVLPPKANFDRSLPQPDEIRISQKHYYIVKAIVDVMTDPECDVKEINSIIVDAIPNAPASTSHPDPTGMFWIYPMNLEFSIDFRSFPVLLQKLISNSEVMFFPGGYKIVRDFDESKPVYAPRVAVSLYCEVWDYISTDFEKANLAAVKSKAAPAGAAKPGGGPARRGR